jgi:two-component system NtrC family sensor kinase
MAMSIEPTTIRCRDPRPLHVLRGRDDGCCDCYSNLSAIVAVLDLEGRVLYGNAAFAAEVAGWDPDGVEPPHLADLWPRVAAALPNLTVHADEDDPPTQVREVSLGSGADEPREHLVHLDPQRDDGGRLRAWILSLVDIAHLRRAERSNRSSLEIERFLSRLSSRFVGSVEVDTSIRESLAELGTLTGASRTFFSSWDPDGDDLDRFHFWNATGTTDLGSLFEEHRRRLRAWYESLFVDLETIELENLREDVPADIRERAFAQGDPLDGCLLMVPLSIDGRLTGMVGIRFRGTEQEAPSSAWVALDIFCHVLERVLQLERSEEALRATNRELKETSAQLVHSEKMASIGQMAAGVAHEINNPIGFVMSNLGTLADYADQIKAALDVCAALDHETIAARPQLAAAFGDLSRDDLAFVRDDLDDLLAESLEGCERVRDIVQNLKGFARSNDQAPRPVDLAECIESTLKVVWNELKYRCEVVKEYGDVPAVVCSPGKINQVILNLLVNAAHAIADQGTITIATAVEDAYAVLRVSDTGCGIDPETQARLFEPFFTTKDPGKGTGLGLYICHDIVSEHRGSIAVESAVGVGSTFTVRLPLNGARESTEEIIG